MFHPVTIPFIHQYIYCFYMFSIADANEYCVNEDGSFDQDCLTSFWESLTQSITGAGKLASRSC